MLKVVRLYEGRQTFQAFEVYKNQESRLHATTDNEIRAGNACANCGGDIDNVHARTSDGEIPLNAVNFNATPAS